MFTQVFVLLLFTRNVVCAYDVNRIGGRDETLQRSFIPLSEGEPEYNSTPESEPEGGSEPEKWPEPGPVWEDAYDTWGAAWEIHIYGFAVCFLFVFLYALYYVIVNVYDGLQEKYLSVCLNVMMVICGVTRALILAFDPYHQGDTNSPATFMRILWSLSDPCLTAADSLCILSLIETFKVSIGPQRLQRPSTIFPVIGVHFMFVLVSDLVVGEFVEAKAMLLFCQVFFITWCSLLGVAYCILAYKLDQLIFKFGDREVPQEGRWYIYLIYASGVSNLATSCVYVYSAAGVFGVYSNRKYVGAWPWWSLQTCLRVTELVAAVLVFTVSAKRAQPQARDQEGPKAGHRNRKQSMFSALRSQKCDVAGKYHHGDDQVYDAADDGTFVEINVERKDSMFTVLRDKTEQAMKS